jgi:hypothetical protein
MSWKTLTEKFGPPEEMYTSPFEALGNHEEQGGGEVVVVAAGAEAPQEAAPEGQQIPAVIHLPAVSQTKQVEVVEAPETFKGELPHLAPEEHQMVVDWFDKASVDESTPLEVRAFLVEIALKLKLDSKKRIVPTEGSVQEGFFDSARALVGLDKKTEPAPVVAPEPTAEELFKKHYPPVEYVYEYKDPNTGTWKVYHKKMWEPTKQPEGYTGNGEGYAFPQQWGLDKFIMNLGYQFPGIAKHGHKGPGYDKLPGVPWRTIFKNKVLYSGVA